MLLGAVFVAFIAGLALVVYRDEQQARPVTLALPEHDIYLAKEAAYTPHRERHPLEGSYCWYCRGTCKRRDL